MKTLKDIVRAGDLAGYLRELATCTQDVLPSLDGNPGNPCYFVILIGDNKGHAGYISNAKRQTVIDWLREQAFNLERKPDEQHPDDKSNHSGEASG